MSTDGPESTSMPSDSAERDPLVQVDGLRKYFWENDSVVDRLLGGDPVAVKAVDGISFDVYRGETLGLVGESGCGKSTAGETLLRLQEPTEGSVHVDGKSVYDLEGADLTAFRRQAQVVFQDPFSSLDPRMTIGEIVRQPLDIHDVGTPEERLERVSDLLERVGLSADQLERYPHEFSGGQRQRIGIARALALEPDFLVLDEPTSALDVSVQAQVLNLLAELQSEFDLTYLLISHNLSVIRHICDRVAVMYLGELVEIGPVEELFADPKHPYTKALLESVPRASTDERERDRETISGDVPSPRDPPSGCRFRTRCPAVIPPADLEVDQPAYRAIMDLRGRLERRDVSFESIDETAEIGSVPDADVSRVASALKSHLLDRELPQEDDDVVEEALSRLAGDGWEAATDLLRIRYESVCEQRRPELGAEDHPVACHLYEASGASDTTGGRDRSPETLD